MSDRFRYAPLLIFMKGLAVIFGFDQIVLRWRRGIWDAVGYRRKITNQRQKLSS